MGITAQRTDFHNLIELHKNDVQNKRSGANFAPKEIKTSYDYVHERSGCVTTHLKAIQTARVSAPRSAPAISSECEEEGYIKSR